MRLTRAPFLLSIAACCAIASLGRSDPALAQAVTPSADQLELLRNLSPEQREQLMRQITGGSTGSSSTRRDSTEQGAVPRDEEEAERLRRSLEETDEERQTEPRIPVLKAEDTVVIKIDFPPEQRDPPVFPQDQQNPQAVPGATPVPSVVPPGQPGTQPVPPPRERVLPLTKEEREKRQKLIDLVRSRNPYRLSRDGVLTLPGFAGIELLGLTEFQATVRLQAEQELRDYDVSLIRLPLKKIGVDALKPYGYDLFDRPPSTFAPVTNVPVPADYTVGAGDLLEVQLYGNQNRLLRLPVGRDGRINFPDFGPISVGGQNFSTVKSSLESRVERQMIGVRASVSMGDTRSIRVFVLGEAKRPGTYVISGLGTITSALFAAGGVKPIGSLRGIQLRRQGALVRDLDLYDMLIRGDTTDDAKLQPGDVVFIPPIGMTVAVEGEVRRPAIYEVKAETTAAEVVQLAGGLTPESDSSRAALTRIDERGQRRVLNIDLTRTEAGAQTIRNGDLLRIVRLTPTLDSGVSVDGHVHSPAAFAYRDGLRLSDVIRSVDDLKPNADLHYVLIRRELPPDRKVAVLSADLGAALQAPGSAADPPLLSRDRVTVFDLETGRERIIRPLVNDLRLQSTINRPTELVSVYGRVRVPGEYPLEQGMSVTDLIRAGGGLSDAAYGGTAELTRYRVVNGESRRTELIQIDLEAVIRGDASADVALEPFDSLSIHELPEWESQAAVTLIGEFRFPGRYSIKRGETLRSVVERAGGLTEYAFPEGSVFTRDELKEREQKQLDSLATRLQNDLVTLALQGAAANQAQAGTALTVGQSLLTQVRTAEGVGRLVIDLRRTMTSATGSAVDIILRDGDRLLVPKFQQEVTVIGEVQTATSHLYRPEYSRDDYLSLSGGVTRRADRENIYVVRADGSVVASQGNRWFTRNSVEVKPGDTVVVPLDTEKLPALPFWQSVTQIIYNLAISAAAVNSF